MQFLSGIFGCGQQLSTTARNLVNSFKENLDDDTDLKQFCNAVEHQDLLDSWAQSFCNIDANGNRLIDDDEFKEYIAKNYRSRLYDKKDKREVQEAAKRHFEIAVRENEGDLYEHAGGLTFKLFVRMMCKLRREVNNSNDADFKFYEFLRKHNAKILTDAPSPDNSDKLAKIIEKAAEWRNDISKHMKKYFDSHSADGDSNIFDDNPLIFFIAIRAQIFQPFAKEYSEEHRLKVATRILSKPSVLQHIITRGKPHKETCLNHAYLMGQPKIARLIVKLKRDLACSSYRGKVFYGENSLHIMIAKNDSKSNLMLDEARWLLGMNSVDEYSFNGSSGLDLKNYLYNNRRKLLHQEAIGTFFDRDHPQHKAYYGELPLSFAVSRNSYEFVKFLVVDCDCWMDKRDKHGNTAAHLAVYHNNFTMFLFLWKLWDLGMDSGKGRSLQSSQARTKFLELESNGNDLERGFTPLVYAAHLGKVDFFTKLWDYMGRSSQLDPDIDPLVNGLMPLQWKWGSIRQFLYPLEQIDPIGQTRFFDTDIDDNSTKESKESEMMKIIALQNVPIFETLFKSSTSETDKDSSTRKKVLKTLETIKSKMVLKTFKRGQNILRQGVESNGKMYIIQSGSCVIYKHSKEKGLEKFHLSVRYFGELGAFGRQVNSQFKYRAATVQALVDSDIWELDVPDPLPNVNIDSAHFLHLRQRAYQDSRNRPCALNEALSQVQSNIMRKPQQEESNHLKLLNTGFLKELIDKKWQRFGAHSHCLFMLLFFFVTIISGEEKFNSFLRWSIFLYIINLLSTIMRYPGKHSNSSFLVEQIHTLFSTGSLSSAEDLGLYVEDLGLYSVWLRLQYSICVLPDVVVIVSSISELRRSYHYHRATLGMKWKPNLLYRLSTYLAVLTLLAYIIETLILFGVNTFQWIPVVLVIACSGVRSVQIIVYLLASASQGEFVVMFMTIMFQDMPQFMMIAIVLTFAFSQIFLLLHSIVGSNAPATTVIGSLKEFWKMLFANFKHVVSNGSKEHEGSIIVEMCSLVAALAITIVLVNMLIASMGETFERVRDSKESEMMYQKARMIAMIELDMPFDERREKKFWVEVKPTHCPEKKHFMVIHDDGVAATANPESATFPDSCQVSLYMPDATLLHEKTGIIVGVRDSVTQQYKVLLQDQELIQKCGQTIVTAVEDSMRWKQPDDDSSAAKSYFNNHKSKKLPSRPYIPKSIHNEKISNSRPSFASPETMITGCAPPLCGGPASPDNLRSQLAPPAGSTRCTAAEPPVSPIRSFEHSFGVGAETSFERKESALAPFATHKSLDSSDVLNVLHSESPSVTSSQEFSSPRPTSDKRTKRKSNFVEIRDSARARIIPVAAPKKSSSKRARDEDTATSLRSQRNLRSKK